MKTAAVSNRRHASWTLSSRILHLCFNIRIVQQCIHEFGCTISTTLWGPTLHKEIERKHIIGPTTKFLNVVHVVFCCRKKIPREYTYIMYSFHVKVSRVRYDSVHAKMLYRHTHTNAEYEKLNDEEMYSPEKTCSCSTDTSSRNHQNAVQY